MTEYDGSDLRVRLQNDGPLSRWGPKVDRLLGNTPPGYPHPRITSGTEPPPVPAPTSTSAPQQRPDKKQSRSAAQPANTPNLARNPKQNPDSQRPRTASDWLALAEWSTTYLLTVISLSLILACGIGFGPTVWVFTALWWTLTAWWLRYRHHERATHRPPKPLPATNQDDPATDR